MGEAVLFELFEASVQRAPDAPALADGDAVLSYRALAEAARAVGAHLGAAGVPPGHPVGLALPRGAASVASVLACTARGSAYVPLDPDYPPARLAYMLRDTGVEHVLASAQTLGALGGYAGGVIDAASGTVLRSGTAPRGTPAVEPGTAYVIYTSGSTGAPKGVLVTQGNVVSMLRAALPLFDLSDADRWSLFHSYNFDFSVWELWGALATGACAVVVPQDVAAVPARFARFLTAQRITVLDQVPSVFKHLVDALEEAPDPAGPAPRYVVFGGERVDLDAVARYVRHAGALARDTRFVNMYGITEITVHATFRELARADLENGARSPIGRALANLEIEVVAEDGTRAADGEAGEMYVAGDGVAAGYLNDARRTAERFAVRDFGGGERRYYRTGDFARRGADGELEYVGRADSQVKVRGFRIELGEIEHALRACPELADAAVAAEPSALGELVLAAYAIPRERPPADRRALVRAVRARLRTTLPAYMVPARFTFVDAFPYGLSGKLDRGRLSELART